MEEIERLIDELMADQVKASDLMNTCNDAKVLMAAGRASGRLRHTLICAIKAEIERAVDRERLVALQSADKACDAAGVALEDATEQRKS